MTTPHDGDSSRQQYDDLRVVHSSSSQSSSHHRRRLHAHHRSRHMEKNPRSFRPQHLRRDDDDEEKKSDSSGHDFVIRQPQHLMNDDNCQYYRIVYRGVVALLSQPEPGSLRSGCYLSYGEVIKSGRRIPTEQDVTAIRVDEVLTGGYAFDPPDPSNCHNSQSNHSETPKRSNVIHGYATTTALSSDPSSPSVTIAISHSSSSDNDDHDSCNTPLDPSTLEATSDPIIRCQHEGVNHQGFVFSHNHKNKSPIVQPLTRPPKCEHGRFFYKIVSTTPLPILSGPSTDAPLSKAMVLPGTVHEVSFRMKLEDGDDGILFLRLARRKGYIASRRGRTRQEPLVKDVTDEIHASKTEQSHADDAATNVSVLSVFSASVPSSTARNPNRRHRPPRRRQKTTKADLRHVHGPGISSITTARTRNHDPTSLSVPSLSSDRLQTPSSNVSLLSDDSMLGLDPQQQQSFSSHENPHTNKSGALSPDRSVARSTKSNISFPPQPQHATFFLMRVTAPRGLRILDAPHFQVNNLIHGTTTNSTTQQQSCSDGLTANKGQHHLFHTMAGRIATTNPAENSVVFDSVTKTRTLPRGAVFEASKRMETSNALFHQGAGLIKLADNSGWAIVPHREELEHQFRTSDGGRQKNMRAYEEIGNCIVFGEDVTDDVWMRVLSRAGAQIVCAPPPVPLNKDGSPGSSPGSSPPVSPDKDNNPNDHPDVGKSDSGSDVASSVGSSFLDAMFRAKNRSEADPTNTVDKGKDQAAEKPQFTSSTIPCGICVRVEPQIPTDQNRNVPPEYARLRGGQGWLPLFANGKPTCIVCPRRNPPQSRFGSFWFRVHSKRGIKVRLGPSKRAPSIKSNDGVYFRFECGEFLRASEVMTVYFEDNNGRTLSESFAKLYRNRHVRLNTANEGQSDFRHLASLTAQAEWVQIFDEEKDEWFLRECKTGPPRIERNKQQGWRYQIAISAGLPIRKGPSFDSEATGMYVAEGETVVIIERVTSAEEDGVTWLRLKEGQGWLHNVDKKTKEKLVIPHSFRHRTKATNTRPSKPRRIEAHCGDDKHQQVAYNTIIARLFHNDLPNDQHPPS
ncbi:expressed unknown protein [Seminavis robusta]|uniref:Uncharacterized protein n=1 Tax=Seminavis robusta TaxID=568900 RepID=A0A9N8HHV5_9STRA|nr:expressed unknown protein [Seminavis robusta]|eukprot:Sro557_g166200.1 n/a (1075) ;mRNA; f:45427-48743